jgi:hypothetical protein
MKTLQYGSKKMPVIVSFFHVQDQSGWHKFLSVNDYAVASQGGLEAFEAHLGKQYPLVELIGAIEVIVANGHRASEILQPAYSDQIRERIEEIRCAHPGKAGGLEPWLRDGDKNGQTALTFDGLRTEIIGDLTQILAVSTKVMGIAAIIYSAGSLWASLVLNDALLSGLRLLDGDVAGDGYMGIIEDPSRCPERWKQIPKERLSARSHRDEPLFSVGYFVLLEDSRYGLALPGRMDGGKIGWSGNEELLNKVAHILADIGILQRREQ